MAGRFLLLLFLALLVTPGCGKKHAKPEIKEEATPVITEKVRKINTGKTILLSGNIEGIKTVRLGFMVAGRIDYIGANEGERVYTDRLLASLDPSGYNIAKELADIQVKQIQDEYDRLRSMYEKNSLSESDFAKITFGLQQAKIQQKLHDKNLSDTRLYSPINGILLKKLAETGEIVGTGIPLFIVSDIRKIRVSAFIPENELHYIRLGQTAYVTVSSLNDFFEGTVTEVGSAADPASRAFSVKIEAPNPDLLIKPGMIAEVNIGTDVGARSLAVPVAAIQRDFNNQCYVFVADTAKNRAFKRYVIIGDLSDNMIEINSGLAEKEIVITGGQQNIVDGSLILISK